VHLEQEPKTLLDFEHVGMSEGEGPYRFPAKFYSAQEIVGVTFVAELLCFLWSRD
jgi:hypothetical protein